MAYAEDIADKVRTALRSEESVVEKKMMGGLTFMVNGKMCVGVLKDDLLCRIDPHVSGEVLGTKGSRVMDFTGRPMRGFLLVGRAGTDSTSDFSYWINLSLAYNRLLSADPREGRRRRSTSKGTRSPARPQ